MADDLERRLREALHREAERIKPRERETEILAMAHDKRQTGRTQRRWLIPMAAAASVALITGVIWGVSNSGSEQATPAVSHPVASVTTPDSVPSAQSSPATSPKPSTSATSDGAAAGATTQVALPAYFVGATSAARDTFGLYREFVQAPVPVNATSAQKARAALAVAMNAKTFTASEPYLEPWSGTTVTDVQVMPSLITITMSGPGASGLTAAQTKLAVQQLVWTAQAAIGQGSPPVKFVIADGSPKLFGTYPTAQTYNRPAKDLQYEVLAPIWITSPVRGQTFPAGTAMSAAGQSCAFEGTTQWQLKNGEKVVRSGVATASSGCPTRGTWQVKLGVLGSGSYTFRMYEGSMQNGQVVAESSKPFTVR